MSDDAKLIETRILTTITDDGHTKTVAIEEVDGPEKQTLLFMVDDTGSDLWDAKRVARKIGTVALGEHWRQWNRPAASRARAEAIVDPAREAELDFANGLPPAGAVEEYGGWDPQNGEWPETAGPVAPLGGGADTAAGEYNRAYVRRWVGVLTSNDAAVCGKISGAVLAAPAINAHHVDWLRDQSHKWASLQFAILDYIRRGTPLGAAWEGLVDDALQTTAAGLEEFRPWLYMFAARLATRSNP
jgi:hypothetical protein